MPVSREPAGRPDGDGRAGGGADAKGRRGRGPRSLSSSGVNGRRVHPRFPDGRLGCFRLSAPGWFLFSLLFCVLQVLSIFKIKFIGNR